MKEIDRERKIKRRWRNVSVPNQLWSQFINLISVFGIIQNLTLLFADDDNDNNV